MKRPAVEGLRGLCAYWLSRDLHLAIITRPDRNSVLLARTEGRVTASPFHSSFCLFSLFPSLQMDKANKTLTHLCWAEKETLPSKEAQVKI